MVEHTPVANRIFISYRRDDSAGITGRIYDRLIQHFGRDTVFKDVDSIPLGVNFKEHIDTVVRACDIALIVIGTQWSGITTEGGQSRLDDPRDFVRLEIEAALQRSIPIIPLLVNNVAMPAETQLPTSMTSLIYMNGMTIGHDPHFHTDVDRLIKSLEGHFARTTSPSKQAGDSLANSIPEITVERLSNEAHNVRSTDAVTRQHQEIRMKVKEIIAQFPDLRPDAQKK